MCAIVATIVFLPSIFSGKLLALGDGATESLPALLAPFRLWQPDMMLGYPLYADPSQAAFYPLRLLGTIPRGFNAYAVFPYVLASTALALYLCDVLGDRIAAVAGALSFAFGGFTISHFGHAMIVHPAAWSVAALASIERFRRSEDRRWLACVTLSIAFAFVSGQPQIGLFGIVIVVGYTAWLECLPAIRDRRPSLLLQAVSAEALGVASAAVLLIPASRLGAESARAALTFRAFLEDSIPGEHLARILTLPYISGGSAIGAFSGPQVLAPVGSFTEATAYLPPALVALALAGLLAKPRAIAGFWMATVALGFMLAIGNELPLATWTFGWWPFNLFRLPGRHAFEITLGTSILAAFGMARLRAAGKPWPLLVTTAVAAIVAGFAFADLANVAPDPLAVGSARAFAVAVGLQVALLVVAAAFASRSRLAGVLALAAVVVGTSVFAGTAYWRDAPDAATFARPAYADTLQRLPRTSGQRVYAYATDPNLLMMPNEPSLFDVPNAAAYTPLSYPGVLDFLHESTNGRFLDLTLPELDLAAIRYIAVPLAATHVTANAGPSPPLELFLTSTGSSASDRVALAPPQPEEAGALEIVSALGASTDVAQGAVIGRVDVALASARAESFELRAGLDTAELAYDRADVGGHVRHRRAPIFEHADASTTWYRTTLPLRARAAVRSVVLRLAPGVRGFNLRQVALLDFASGTAYRFGPDSILYARPDRFRLAATAGAIGIFENRDARDHAWIERPATATLDRDAAVTMRRDSSGDRRYDVRCRIACRLVMSDRYDNEWQGSVDERTTRFVRVHDVLTAVDLPSGEHLVEARYIPLRLYRGVAVTLTSLALAGSLAFWPRRRRARSEVGRQTGTMRT